jgi:hypothetical protein
MTRFGPFGPDELSHGKATIQAKTRVWPVWPVWPETEETSAIPVWPFGPGQTGLPVGGVEGTQKKRSHTPVGQTGRLSS